MSQGTAPVLFLKDLVEILKPDLAALLDLDHPTFLPPLAALMPSRQWDKVEHKLRCLGRISRSDLDLRRRYVLGKVVDKYLELDD